jgi:hypothetical protein
MLQATTLQPLKRTIGPSGSGTITNASALLLLLLLWLLLLLLSCFTNPCRAPRLTWDCGLLSNRVQLAPNLTLTLNHLILANCSTNKPLSIIRLSAGSRVLINDSIIVQPPGLCMSLQEQASSALHSARPAGVAGVQSITPGAAGSWCAHNDSNGLQPSRVQASNGAGDNSSYTAVKVTTDNLGLFANTTGGRSSSSSCRWCAHRLVFVCSLQHLLSRVLYRR